MVLRYPHCAFLRLCSYFMVGVINHWLIFWFSSKSNCKVTSYSFFVHMCLRHFKNFCTAFLLPLESPVKVVELFVSKRLGILYVMGALF